MSEETPLGRRDWSTSIQQAQAEALDAVRVEDLGSIVMGWHEMTTSRGVVVRYPWGAEKLAVQQ